MKALLYSDWASLRKSMKSFLFSIFMICGIVTFVSISNEGMNAETVAETIQSNIMATGSLMFAFFSFFNLFGQDEHAGWESVKLSLPVSRREVVIGRYLIMAIIIVVLLVIGAILGAAIAAIATMVKYGTVTIMPLWMVAVTIAIALSATLIYLAIEMPIFFKLGLSKARLYFTLPFFACMLFMLEPVQRFFEGLAARFGTIAEIIGNPAPILAVLIVIAFVLYGISSLISTRIYEKREF
ncbi:MAG: ABC-2 transporter permease [Atopobiaceae bacterium]|nr:ABC-2 transporter permease [Atopobiaceae bacterium]